MRCRLPAVAGLVVAAASLAGCAYTPSTTPRTCRLLTYRSLDVAAETTSLVAPASEPPDDVLEPSYIASRRSPNAPKHLVVLFHGVNIPGELPDWIFAIKDAVFRRTGLKSPDLEVCIFDWTPHSFSGVWDHYIYGTDKSLRPYSILSTQACAKLLADGGKLHSVPGAQHIHFITHSRGGSAGCHVARILAEAGVTVDHLTVMDGLDPLMPHGKIEKFNDPPIRPEVARWSDNYFADGFFYGLLDIDNYFLVGNQRRHAGVNVHFKYLNHFDSHDLYLRSIEDASIPFGFQWSRLGGGYDPKRRIERTIEVELPRVFIDGPLKDVMRVEHRLKFWPEQSNTPRILSEFTGPIARYLRPGTYEVILTDVRTGKPAPYVHEVIRHGFDADPSADVRQVVEGNRFTILYTDLGVDHVFHVGGNRTQQSAADIARPPHVAQRGAGH